MRRSAALTGPAVLSIPRSWNIYLRAAEYRPPGRFTISAALPLGSSGEMYARADPDLCRKRVLLGEQPDHDNEPESLFMARDTRHVLLIETGPDDRPIRSRREASKAVADTTHAAKFVTLSGGAQSWWRQLPSCLAEPYQWRLRR